MKKFLFLNLFLLVCLCAVNAQGLFKPVPKPDITLASSLSYRGVLTAIPTEKTTTSVTVFRPDVIAVTAYDTKGLNYAMAGVGVSLSGADWDDTNQRYAQTWSVGAYAYAKGAISPTAPKDVFAAGINGAYKLYTGGFALSTAGQLLFNIGIKMPISPLN